MGKALQPASLSPLSNICGRSFSVLLDLAVWNVLGSLGAPFKKFLALLLFLSRSFSALLSELQRWALSTIGWLSAPPTLPVLRHLGPSFLHTRRWHFGAAGLVLILLYRALFAKWREWTSPHYRELQKQRRILATATSYEAWIAAWGKSEKLQAGESSNGLARWKRETKLYDRKLLQERVQHLRAVKKGGDVHEMMFAVRADLLRNLGNMCNTELHEAHSTVPSPIRDYIGEVQSHLEYLTAYSGAEITLADKLTFLRETRHAFGRTALVLSGGGALGAFHVGVVKSLFQQGLLPRVISGSSVGSIVAATTATRNDAELQELFSDAASFDLSFFSNTTASQFLRHFLLKGTLQDVEVLQKRLRRLVGEGTFLEAFMHSGRILNVAVCPADTNEPPRVLNYLSAPNVLVWSAVSCSSAFPFLYMPQELLAKNSREKLVKFNAESVQQTERRWRDGSLEEDLPMRSLSEMFNVNYFLVSQTNPHIVPALNLKKRVNRKLGNVVETEWKHRCRQLMAIWPSLQWLKCFSQPWEGDVTIVLPSSYMQIKKSITNPSSQDLLEACQQGERGTWEKLAAIRANCGIELTIDACLAKLTNEAKQKRLLQSQTSRSSVRQSQSLRARSPSWINLQAYGMPMIPSDDQLMECQDSLKELHSPRGAPSNPRPILADPRGERFPRNLSISGLSDNLRAPGINSLSCVKEMASSSESSEDGVDETETPPCEDTQPSLLPSSDDDEGCRAPNGTSRRSSDSDAGSLYAGLPPAPGRDRMESADTLLETLPTPDPRLYSRNASMSAFDCCDRSVNVWETLLPLAASSMGGQGIDVIAP